MGFWDNVFKPQPQGLNALGDGSIADANANGGARTSPDYAGADHPGAPLDITTPADPAAPTDPTKKPTFKKPTMPAMSDNSPALTDHAINTNGGKTWGAAPIPSVPSRQSSINDMNSAQYRQRYLIG